MDVKHIHISGVNFTIECRNAEVSLPVDSAYASFKINSANSFEDIQVTVYLETEKLPEVNRSKKIFDSELSWSVFLDQGMYYISLQPEGFENPIWLATVDLGSSMVTVYCGKELMHVSEGRWFINSPVCYPLDQILLMYILSKKGALIHAAGADFRNKGLVFPGKSGAGKSTLARQFVKRNQWKLLSDDRMVVRGGHDQFQAYGTPWPGEAGVAENLNVPVSGIFFLKQDLSNKIRDLKKKEAYEKILPVVSIPWYDKKVFPEIMGFCEDMVIHNPCYEFSFIPGDGAVDALERFIDEYL